MKDIITVNNLTKYFKAYGKADTAAVNNVSFTLHEVETLALVG